jgi:hypothetical protein
MGNNAETDNAGFCRSYRVSTLLCCAAAHDSKLVQVLQTLDQPSCLNKDWEACRTGWYRFLVLRHIVYSSYAAAAHSTNTVLAHCI